MLELRCRGVRQPETGQTFLGSRIRKKVGGKVGIRDVGPCHRLLVDLGKPSIARAVEQFTPQVESMEGAAFMYACLMYQVPFAGRQTASSAFPSLSKSVAIGTSPGRPHWNASVVV